MQLGLVTNCWQRQLAGGTPLEDLVGEAVRRGLRVIELRQTALGRYETGEDHLPNAAALTALIDRFPAVRFNVALGVPFLQPEFSASEPTFVAGKWAADAVAGEYPPHLRLVDVATAADELPEPAPDAVVATLTELTGELAEIDGVLSIENARQPWGPFRAVFEAARRTLGTDAHRLRLCYDPCNLLLAGEAVDPAAVTASLEADWLAMVHFKQRREGRILDEMADGELDWRKQIDALKEIGYRGPGLFEIAPSDGIWEKLAAGSRYLERHGLEVEGTVTEEP